MDSPIFQPVPTPNRKIVFGSHATKEYGAIVSVCGIGTLHERGRLWIKMRDEPTQVSAADLRELAQLFTEMADILDGK